MADWNQFEGFEAEAEALPAQCMVCEAMLPEAVDGTLSAAEQRAFERHVATCVHCARELDEAQRGAAWLAMLKTQTPEPPARLLAKILAETTGANAAAEPSRVRESAPVVVDSYIPGFVPDWQRPRATSGWSATVAAFKQQVIDVFSFDAARTTFQPRMAMTAAMAFFSIALTLNLTGVRLRDLRAGDFTPSGLRRTVADTSATAVRNFQNLRVVYQVESRVSELRSDDVLGSGHDAMQSRGQGTQTSAPANPEPRNAEPQGNTQPDSSKQDSQPRNSTPKGHSDLVLPLPERAVRGSGVTRKAV